MSDLIAVRAAFDARAKADKAAQDFVESIPEDRAMTAEESEQYARLNEQFAQASQAERDVLERAAANAANDEARAALNLPDLEAGGDPNAVTVSDEVRAFADWMSAGGQGEFTVENRNNSQGIERRSNGLDSVTATGASEVVPTTLYDMIWNGIYDRSMILQSGARIMTMASGEPLNLPKKTARSTAAWVAEGDPIPENDPTTDKLPLGKKKLGNIATTTNELERDGVFNVGQWVIEDLMDVMADEANAGFVVGAGNATEPGGLISAPAGVTLGSAVAPTNDQIIDLIHSVKASARRGSVFFFADTTIAEIRKLKDTTGRYYWQPATHLGQQPTLHGYSVWDEPAMANFDDSASVTGVFGNMRGFVIRRIGPVSIVRSTEYRYNTDEVAYRGTLSADSGVLDDTLIKTLRTP